MKNWSKLILAFILAVVLSILLFAVALSNFCLRGGFFSGGDCSGKSDALFLFGLISSFLLFPVFAIILLKLTNKRSKFQNASLFVFAFFPIISIVSLIVGSLTLSRGNREIQCFPIQRKLAGDLEEKAVDVKIKEAKLIGETNYEKKYEFVVEIENLPKSFDKFSFSVVRFDNEPNESEKDYPYPISNYTNSVLISRKDGALEFKEDVLLKSVKISENSFRIEEGIWKKDSSKPLPKKAKIFVWLQSSDCQLKPFNDWVDLPQASGE